MASRSSYESAITAVTTDSQLEADLALKEKLMAFYRMYDPHKLEDETEVNGLVRWARKYGVEALHHLLFRKYGVDMDTVDSSEDAWEAVKADLALYYRKHDKTKTAAELDKIYLWARQNGLGALNSRLMAKYGVPLSSVRAAGGWKNRWRHVIANQTLENLRDQLQAFFAKHDPGRTVADAETLAAWALEHGGADALNETLMTKYGRNLSDVRMAEGATSDERKYNLRQRLAAFFTAHDPSKSTEDVLHAMADWGAVNYDALNQHLLVTYGYDLDSSAVVPEVMRERLYAFFSKHDPTNKKKRGAHTLEDLVKLAVDKGLEALKQRLLHDYGRTLPEDGEEEADAAAGRQDQQRQQQQGVKKAGGVMDGVRRSLSKAIRRSFKLDDST